MTETTTTQLERSVSLPMLILYGTGVTIGAGIYALIGETVGRAGQYAPASFLLAAIVMAFTAGSFAELSARVPQAAGEAVYVEAAFRRKWLTLLVGLAVLLEAIIAAATIGLGSAGYLSQFFDLPEPFLAVGVILTMSAIAAWGIRESVLLAGAMTIVEVAALLVIIGAGLRADPAMLASLLDTIPAPNDSIAISGVFSASLIAFFAFIGFDDIVNLVEEAKEPQKSLPWAIGITLIMVTLIYFLVTLVAVRLVPLDELATSSAPVSLLFERLTGLPPQLVTIVAIIATMNGVVIVVIMAARVTYGLSKQQIFPSWIGAVSPRTQTPLRATVLIAIAVAGAALYAPIDVLAEKSSQVLLLVFVMINLALVRLKLSDAAVPERAVRVPMWVPVLGVVSCIGLLFGAYVSGA